MQHLMHWLAANGEYLGRAGHGGRGSVAGLLPGVHQLRQREKDELFQRREL